MSQGLGDTFVWGTLQCCHSPAAPDVDCYVVWSLYGQAVSVGRGLDNTIIIPMPYTSVHHCVIYCDPADDYKVTVKDVSSNGIWINFRKIEKYGTATLKHGDILSLGTDRTAQGPNEHHHYIFQLSDSIPAPSVTNKSLVVRDFEIVRVLGHGGFGHVHMARRRAAPHDLVAIKQLNKVKCGLPASASSGHPNGTYVEQAMKEILNQQRAHVQRDNSSDNDILRIYEFFYELDGSFNIVMELAAGGSLTNYIKKHEDGLAENEAKYFAYQICDVVHFLHTMPNPITHRDLKPDNVLLTTDIPPRIKLADFGMAHDGTHNIQYPCGSRAFFAPEMRTGEGTYDYRADIYSVGCLVFSMLTKRMVFRPSSQQSAITGPDSDCEEDRHVEWSALAKKGVSFEGRNFVEGLMAFLPEERMSLEMALLHAWFADVVKLD
ncbi:kinase-like protein [Fistulina hepatica ATCC 64428]|uniref:Kinase-like protein n=1 Tax=Fistulina hepatica ATCC 64428 TaxID=1128425 RepID=A0A0D7AIL1_9AGAR|nr:kinase-like protein [Fistulina hepatica ATCC 64428]